MRAFAALISFLILLLTTGSASSATMPSDASRAQKSFAALQRLFGASDGSHLFREMYPAAKADRPYSYEWPFSQVHVAALDLTGLPGRLGSSYDKTLADADTGQMRYWSASAPGGHPGFSVLPLAPYGKGGPLYYDDNEWAGLEAMQDYAQHPSKSSLRQAERIFDLVISGWDQNTAHPRAGGIFWTQARGNHDRNTVSNMPAAELGLRLYQVTGQQTYLSWAMKIYSWTVANLQRSDGLFYDHVDLRGNVDRSLWSYNQGVPIAVNVLLYRVTKDPKYLQEAERIASAAYQYFVVGNRLKSQPIYFNAIMFKHMLALESVTGGTQYRAAMQTYADSIWNQSRDPKTGVFRFGSNGRTDLIEQAGATQIFATLAWPQSALADIS
jgi:hypothetical protein